MRKQVVTVAILLMITATILLAHDLFLKLDSYFVPPNSAVRVAVLNGTFAKSEGPVTADRLLDLSLVGPSERRAQGVARFVIRTPGKWYVKFINMVPVSGDSVNYESKWATLTFQVR